MKNYGSGVLATPLYSGGQYSHDDLRVPNAFYESRIYGRISSKSLIRSVYRPDGILTRDRRS